MAADGGGPREEDILRVLISTDNHLGFLERDAIRGADSFAAFEEVLQLAVAREVDTVLLAGDIFHENRPSRYTLWRTMEILRTYVMGPAQIRVQCVSDYDAARVLAPSAAKPVLVVAGAGVGAGAGARAGAGAGGAGVDGGAGGVGAGAPTGRRSRAQIAADDKAAAAVAARASRAAAAAALAPPPATSAESRARVFGMFSRVNWEDPNFNIALPIFSIHGNHDDPSREGPGEGSILAPLDILAAASLVNYFGKAESTDSVSLVPVLLAKGATRLALYGVGNVREDRMQRMFQADKVRFRRPAALSEDWFNLLLIHQNRDQRTLRTKSQSLGIDACLPSFLDVVVWGHEHECILATEHCSRRPDADADDVDGGIARSTRIIQPGSTVATSLCEGEARRKHAVVLEICGPLYRRINVPLRCVRPFKMAEISLASEGLDADAADVGERIVALLTKKVEELIADAARGWPEDADGGGDAGQETEDMRPPRAMRLPLVRLKVEVSVEHCDVTRTTACTSRMRTYHARPSPVPSLRTAHWFSNGRSSAVRRGVHWPRSEPRRNATPIPPAEAHRACNGRREFERSDPRRAAVAARHGGARGARKRSVGDVEGSGPRPRHRLAGLASHCCAPLHAQRGREGNQGGDRDGCRDTKTQDERARGREGGESPRSVDGEAPVYR